MWTKLMVRLYALIHVKPYRYKFVIDSILLASGAWTCFEAGKLMLGYKLSVADVIISIVAITLLSFIVLLYMRGINYEKM